MKFQPSQLVLKYNDYNEIKPRKFKVRWLGPFKIREVGENRAIKVKNLDRTLLQDSINGLKLKPCQERKEETIGINMLGHATKEDWAISGNQTKEE